MTNSVAAAQRDLDTLMAYAAARLRGTPVTTISTPDAPSVTIAPDCFSCGEPAAAEVEEEAYGGGIEYVPACSDCANGYRRMGRGVR